MTHSKQHTHAYLLLLTLLRKCICYMELFWWLHLPPLLMIRELRETTPRLALTRQQPQHHTFQQQVDPDLDPGGGSAQGILRHRPRQPGWRGERERDAGLQAQGELCRSGSRSAEDPDAKAAADPVWLLSRGCLPSAGRLVHTLFCYTHTCAMS